MKLAGTYLPNPICNVPFKYLLQALKISTGWPIDISKEIIMLNSVKGSSPISQNDPAVSGAKNHTPAAPKSEAAQDKVTLSSQVKQAPKAFSADKDLDGDNH